MRTVKAFASLVLVCALSACDTRFPDWLAGPVAEPGPKAGIDEIVLAPAEPAGLPKNRESPAAEQASLPPTVDDDPQKLVGLDPHGLAERLGSPGFVRRDGSAEIWQYPAKSCILDVFLYRNEDKLSVDYVELRGRGSAGQSRQACFQEMLRAHLAAQRS